MTTIDLAAEALKTMQRMNTVAVAAHAPPVPFNRPDLFKGYEPKRAIGAPPNFRLHPGLTEAQRAEAYDIAERAFPAIAYSTSLFGDVISTCSAD